MTLADLTSPGLMVPYLSGADAATAIKELAQALRHENHVPDVLPYYEAALNREFMASTGMEAGMAFPHARVAGMRRVAFALGRSDQPLRWGPLGAKSVRLVFLLAVPTTDSIQYLQLVSGLVRLSKDAARMSRLLSAPDTFQMLEVLGQVALRSIPGVARVAGNQEPKP